MHQPGSGRSCEVGTAVDTKHPPGITILLHAPSLSSPTSWNLVLRPHPAKKPGRQFLGAAATLAGNESGEDRRLNLTTPSPHVLGNLSQRPPSQAKFILFDLEDELGMASPDSDSDHKLSVA